MPTKSTPRRTYQTAPATPTAGPARVIPPGPVPPRLHATAPAPAHPHAAPTADAAAAASPAARTPRPPCRYDCVNKGMHLNGMMGGGKSLHMTTKQQKQNTVHYRPPVPLSVPVHTGCSHSPWSPAVVHAHPPTVHPQHRHIPQANWNPHTYCKATHITPTKQLPVHVIQRGDKAHMQWNVAHRTAHCVLGWMPSCAHSSVMLVVGYWLSMLRRLKSTATRDPPPRGAAYTSRGPCFHTRSAGTPRGSWLTAMISGESSTSSEAG